MHVHRQRRPRITLPEDLGARHRHAFRVPGSTPSAGCVPTARLLDLRAGGRADTPAGRRPSAHGWTPPETRLIPDWCGCSVAYVPVLAGDGWWHLVPIWGA